jgi:hypothetical protein
MLPTRIELGSGVQNSRVYNSTFTGQTLIESRCSLLFKPCFAGDIVIRYQNDEKKIFIEIIVGGSKTVFAVDWSCIEIVKVMEATGESRKRRCSCNVLGDHCFPENRSSHVISCALMQQRRDVEDMGVTGIHFALSSPPIESREYGGDDSFIFVDPSKHDQSNHFIVSLSAFILLHLSNVCTA